MSHDQTIPDRRALSRRLSRINDAEVSAAIGGLADNTGEIASERENGTTVRIGITGSPGTGKSTLIAQLAKHRLTRGVRIGVLAIDPSSPITKGSLLGDRIRMDEVANHPGIFIRSLPSRNAHDGLSDNTADLLHAMAAHRFDEVMLETVGVGQADYAVKTLVDTVVLVMMPGSGDAIQAMKAGILETADIYVVNKSDMPGAEQSASEVESILALRLREEGRWRPLVIKTRQNDPEGIAALSEAIDRHLAWSRQRIDPLTIQRRRTRYHLQSLINRRVEEIIEGAEPALFDAPLPEIFQDMVRALAETLP